MPNDLAYIGVKWQRYTRSLDRFKAAKHNGAEEETLDYMREQLDELYSSYHEAVAHVESVTANLKQH